MGKRKSQKNLTPEVIRERELVVSYLELRGEMKDFIADRLEQSDEARTIADVVRGCINRAMRATREQAA